MARQPLLVLAVLAAMGLLAACATRPETGFLLPVTRDAAGATDRTLLVATTRERDARPGTLYNGERGQPLDDGGSDGSHSTTPRRWPD